jgi:hypothetical protein
MAICEESRYLNIQMLLNAHVITDCVIYVAIDIRQRYLFSEAYVKKLDVSKVPRADDSAPG